MSTPAARLEDLIALVRDAEKHRREFSQGIPGDDATEAAYELWYDAARSLPLSDLAAALERLADLERRIAWRESSDSSFVQEILDWPASDTGLSRRKYDLLNRIVQRIRRDYVRFASDQGDDKEDSSHASH